MKATGIVRKVDNLGRIVLPMELRRTMDIARDDLLQISMAGGEIRLTKFQPACLFCDESLEVVDFRGKRVCRGCIRKLQKSLKVNKRRPVRGRR